MGVQASKASSQGYNTNSLQTFKMKIKANSENYKTYLDKKRFSLLPDEQKVFSKVYSGGLLLEQKSYKRKVWQDKITKKKWAFVKNGYWQLDDNLVATVEIAIYNSE
jgi:hypothetical protein